MRTKLRPLTPDEVGKLIALLAVMLGAFIYLYQPAIAGFPINDGGLFYTMIRAIQTNRFALPAYVQYNGLAIPFAYPPLALYLGAALSTTLRLDPLAILQWLPALLLIAISFNVYGLARGILNSSMQAGLATFLYVFTPGSTTWLIMGGGLTRGLGRLFFVLTLASVYALYTRRSRRFLIASILFGSLAVLSHPEAALHTAAGCALIWVFKGRSKSGVTDSVAVAAGVMALSSVWWLRVLIHYGPGPFGSASQTGLQTPVLLLYPMLLSFSEEPKLAIVAALGLVGLIVCVARREYFLPAWLFLPFVVEPRSAATISVLPLALMASRALDEVILPAIAGLDGNAPGTPMRTYFDSTAAKILLGYIGIYLLVIGLYASTQLVDLKLSRLDRSALQWAATSTPPESRFLIMTGTSQLFCDPVQEWFPALTHRISETTIQGEEWTRAGGFSARIVALQQLQQCVQADAAADCMRRQAAAAHLMYDYVYVSRQAVITQLCRPIGHERRGQALVMQLQADGGYRSVYASHDVEIFAVRHYCGDPVLAEKTKASKSNQVKDSVSR